MCTWCKYVNTNTNIDIDTHPTTTERTTLCGLSYMVFCHCVDLNKNILGCFLHFSSTFHTQLLKQRHGLL